VSGRLGLSAEELAMGSRLPSNQITRTAKVDTLIPLGFFHSFLSCILRPIRDGISFDKRQ
jgi:hypothetical protein